MIGHLEEKNANKYLALDHADENKEVSKKKNEILRNEIKKVFEATKMVAKKIEYGKDF